jgi:hypothetical protein
VINFLKKSLEKTLIVKNLGNIRILILVILNRKCTPAASGPACTTDHNVLGMYQILVLLDQIKLSHRNSLT